VSLFVSFSLDPMLSAYWADPQIEAHERRNPIARALDRFNLWFDKQAGQWVDESVADPSLQARANQSGNLVTRRLKHFSDYYLWVGLGSYNVTSGMGGDEFLWGAW